MRKAIVIFGTLLITAVLIISGSAVATWTYATSVYSDINCENSENALYEDDNTLATVGTNTPSTLLGSLILDFGYAGIPDSKNVIVYGQGATGEDEDYRVRFLRDDLTPGTSSWSSDSSDQTDNTFTTGTSGPGRFWEFIEIEGRSGQTGLGDLIYGPEIDAVGYET